MAPCHEAPVHTNADYGRHRSINYRNTVAMTRDSGALDPIEESSEANLGVAGYTMRTQPLPFDALRRRDARRLVVRAGVTLITRRVRLNYLDIWEQGLNRSQNVN